MGDVFGPQGMAAVMTGNFDVRERATHRVPNQIVVVVKNLQDVTRPNRFGKVQPFVGQQILHATL
jgi:hypothetical protein